MNEQKFSKAKIPVQVTRYRKRAVNLQYRRGTNKTCKPILRSALHKLEDTRFDKTQNWMSVKKRRSLAFFPDGM